MTNKYVLGIDNGGTVTKAAIYDVAGKVHAIAQAHLDPHLDEYGVLDE